MRRVFIADVGDLSDVLERVLGNADELPDYEDLSTSEADALHEWASEDDFLLDLVVLREAAYEHAEGAPDDIDPHGAGAEVLEREVFRAAEWLDSSVRLYVRARVEEYFEEGSIDA